MTRPIKADATHCVHHPAPPLEGFQSLAIPTYRASTIVFENAQAYRDRAQRHPDGYIYGLAGTPTTRALEIQLSQLHGGSRSIVTPSGQAAITLLMLTLLESGDHVLITDYCYPPVRDFASEVLSRRGVDVEWFSPEDLDALSGLIRDGQTRLIWLESPGSTSMEMADLPAIASMARSRGVLTGCDNTWATALLCKPLALGIDFVAEALTKYVGGHSDILLGSIAFADEGVYGRVRRTCATLGVGVSPDDCALALRGLETMALRLAHVGGVAQEFAERFVSFGEPFQVRHPGLPDSPGHDLWRRDFSGGAGVFTLKVSGCSDKAVDEALDALRVFAIGASWGGTRSIIAPQSLSGLRSCIPVEPGDTYLRISVGLEAPDDLWRDLEAMASILTSAIPTSKTINDPGLTS